MRGNAGARGEDAGPKAFFLRERAMLLRLLHARLQSMEEAEDVLREVWLRLESVTDSAIVRPTGQPGGYLFRIANNVAIDRRRARLFRDRREERRAEAQGITGDVAPAGEAALVAADLPERTTHIFRLDRYEQIRRGAIAGPNGISVSAVEKHLQRAYRAIHHLADDGDPAPAIVRVGQGR
jgi:DNA-directed RNA polymerase specialized sigma24 family protein